MNWQLRCSVLAVGWSNVCVDSNDKFIIVSRRTDIAFHSAILAAPYSAAASYGTKLWYVPFHSGASKDSGHWHETLLVGNASPSNTAPHTKSTETSNYSLWGELRYIVCLEGTMGLLFVLIQSNFILTFVRCLPLLGICKTEPCVTHITNHLPRYHCSCW